MKRNELQLNIISAEKSLFTGAVSSVVLPGERGRFGVYPDHAPLISPLGQGTVAFIVDGVEQSLVIKGGIAEINDGVVTICADGLVE